MTALTRGQHPTELQHGLAITLGSGLIVVLSRSRHILHADAAPAVAVAVTELTQTLNTFLLATKRIVLECPGKSECLSRGSCVTL